MLTVGNLDNIRSAPLPFAYWFFSGFPRKKPDRHDLTEILLKVSLNTIILNLTTSGVYVIS
jgi:hypothetical protein